MTALPARSMRLAILMIVVLSTALVPGTALADDGTPPTLTALSFTPASVVNDSAPVAMTVNATITDATGVVDLVRDPDTNEVLVEGPTIQFTAPRGSATVVGFLHRTSGDNFTVDVTFPAYAAIGTWTAVVSAPDLDYNWMSLDSAALVDLGFPGGVAVSGTDDVTAPTLVSITPSTQTVDVGDCDSLNRVVQFDAVITDDFSGFYEGSPIIFTSPNGDSYQTGFDPQGQPADHYLVQLFLDMNTETGIWTASQADLTDVVGNVNQLFAGDLASSFEVTYSPQGSAPGAPTNVTVTIAADGEATVHWTAPADDGGRAITGYGITVGFGNQGSATGADTSATSASIGVLDAGVTYTVAVAAGNPCGSTYSDSLTVAAIPATGGTVSTGSVDGLVTTDVVVPAGVGGGSVTITETPVDTAPAGYEFSGEQFVITSTATTTVNNPLTLVFHLDPSITLPALIFRNGVPITSSCSPVGTATPSPCIAAGGGTADITILTASASTWNVGRSLGYNFSGFLGDVRNPPTVNQVKAGDTVKLSFSLAGNQGPGVIAAGYPASASHACGSAGPADATDPTLAGSKGLTFDVKKGVYTYSWNTSSAWKKTCRTFVLKLTDGTFHYAEFSFK